MAKNLTPKCKLCRREGQKLYLKGERCNSPKCIFTKRNYPPGIHGNKGYPRHSDYGVHLREKQKVKRIYGLLERQFKKYFNLAQKQKGKTTENMILFLTLRLDNIVYLLGLANSRAQARQIVNHGFIYLNDKSINIPSAQIKIGDRLAIAPKKDKSKLVANQKKFLKRKETIPTWIQFDKNKLSAKIIALPKAEELIPDINFQLIVEYYSK